MSSDEKTFLFCDVDLQWFKTPFDVSLCLDFELEWPWELVDADAGLLCYTDRVNGKVWLCVSNPLTHSFQVLPPECLPSDDSQRVKLASEMVKLIVDRETKTFKVILLLSAQLRLHTTVVFDSRTNSWTDCQCVPSQFQSVPSRFHFKSGARTFRSIFMRNNVVYVSISYPNPHILEKFDIDLGKWSQVEAELPCNDEKFLFTSNRDRVMLVELNSGEEEEPVTVWRHLENIPESIPIFSTPRWEKVEIDFPICAAPSFLGAFVDEDLVESCFSYGSEYLCFILSERNKWVRYTFATKTWDAMPEGPTNDSDEYGRYGYHHKWFVWEPSLDVVLSSRGTVNISGHPELGHGLSGWVSLVGLRKL